MWNSEIHLRAHCSIHEEIKPKIYFHRQEAVYKSYKMQNAIPYKINRHTKKKKKPYCDLPACSPSFFYMLTQNSNYRSCKLTSVFQNYELYVKHVFSLKQLPLIKTVKANTTQVQPTAVPSNISNCLLSNTLNKLQQTVFTTNKRKHAC